MDQWLEEERLGILNTAPPPSLLDLVTEGNVVAAEVGPSKVPEQEPPTNAEEEVMASNPPPAVEEPATSGFMGNHDLINLEEEEELTTVVDNDSPA